MEEEKEEDEGWTAAYNWAPDPPGLHKATEWI